MVREGLALALLGLGFGCGSGATPARNAENDAPHGGMLVLEATASGTRCERYFPLVEGIVYQYVISRAAQPAGVVVTRAHRADALTGELRVGAEAKGFVYRPEGVMRAGLGVYVLREPLLVGSSWPGAHGGQERVVAVDVIAEVPAGRFAGCIRTQEDQPGELLSTFSSTYCPGVGLVVLEVSGDAGDERAELQSYGPPVDLGPDGISRIPVTPPP
ncbi:hypothetical protein [Chondromyces crocatus]|uniref:Lipoprotein n=1 Tax=Chondromyces crocatus TaxID=52 RepID=A0A0K1E6E3_CHOCO|nr:hypothetical protein [Chondromyces crocatus]AKT36252.1 uncharacterized protein CMC5_003660 [Chondromyces crocatus]